MNYTGSPGDAAQVTETLLPLLLLVSAALTAPLSLLLLSLYRRAVMRVMAAFAGGAKPPVDVAATAAPSGPPLTIELLNAATAAAAEVPEYERALRSLRAATLVYVAAGSAYAIVLTSPWLWLSDEGAPLPRVLWLLSCYLWPTALAVGMLAAVGRRQRALVAVAYFSMLFAVALYGVSVNARVSMADLATFWLMTNAPATVLLLAFLHRRVRAVGPLVLAFMAVAAIGTQFLLSVMGSNDPGWRADVPAAGDMAGGDSNVWFGVVLGLAIFAVVGWWLLKALGRRYEQRRTSDQALTLDAMWLLFGVVQSIAFGFRGWIWILTGFVGFAAYKLVSRAGFDLAGVTRPEPTSPTLLLLRVFALGDRSERLFDALSKRWLRAGSICMIAGPDLVASAVEPHEFLDYLGGRLSSRFVRGGEDLDRRLGMIERGPDPDGRYRVNEFFCYADTWQETMTKLAGGADAILMDLRSFSRVNQGCLFELQQLIASVPLERVVFLIDDTTDRVFLESVLQASWALVDARSPNRRGAPPRARLIHNPEDAVENAAGIVKLLMAGRKTPTAA